jgi:hypothetical protein
MIYEFDLVVDDRSNQRISALPRRPDFLEKITVFLDNMGEISSADRLPCGRSLSLQLVLQEAVYRESFQSVYGMLGFVIL